MARTPEKESQDGVRLLARRLNLHTHDEAVAIIKRESAITRRAATPLERPSGR